jgi:CheY-like chemotaxis protein
MKERLNILVVEDTPIQQESTRIQLAGEYELRIATTFSL